MFGARTVPRRLLIISCPPSTTFPSCTPPAPLSRYLMTGSSNRSSQWSTVQAVSRKTGNPSRKTASSQHIASSAPKAPLAQHGVVQGSSKPVNKADNTKAKSSAPSDDEEVQRPSHRNGKRRAPVQGSEDEGDHQDGEDDVELPPPHKRMREETPEVPPLLIRLLQHLDAGTRCVYALLVCIYSTF